MSWLPSWSIRTHTEAQIPTPENHRTKKRYDAVGEIQKLNQEGYAARDMSQPGAICQEILQKYPKLEMQDLKRLADQYHTCRLQNGDKLTRTFQNKGV